LHLSATSHWPAAGRHTAVLFASAGHTVDPPHVSASSHTPAAARQTVVAGAATCWQPIVALHESIVQTLPSSQFGGAPPTHVPFEQVSLPLQALPSLQLVPTGTGVCTGAPVVKSHESAVQALPSLIPCAPPKGAPAG
jgi:hypothetical protein